jgi:hypothetical protein
VTDKLSHGNKEKAKLQFAFLIFMFLKKEMGK